MSLNAIFDYTIQKVLWKSFDVFCPTWFCSPYLFLVFSLLTVIITLQVIFYDLCIGRMNPETFCASLTSCCHGVSGPTMPISSSISEALSASQLSLLSFGLFKSPFQSSQFSVSKMISGTLSSLVSVGWLSILLIQLTFSTSVCSLERTVSQQVGNTGDLSNNLNSATLSS